MYRMEPRLLISALPAAPVKMPVLPVKMQALLSTTCGAFGFSCSFRLMSAMGHRLHNGCLPALHGPGTRDPKGQTSRPFQQNYRCCFQKEVGRLGGGKTLYRAILTLLRNVGAMTEPKIRPSTVAPDSSLSRKGLYPASMAMCDIPGRGQCSRMLRTT